MRFKSSSRKPVQPELVASGDQRRPVLTKVHLNAEASEVWVTDSFMAARFPVELDEGDTSGPIPIEALKASRKPPLKGQETSITLNGTAEVKMSHGENASAPYLTVPRESSDYTFPNLSQLIPDNLSDFEIGLNAAKLAQLAKAMGSDEVRIRFANAPEKAEGDGIFGPSNLRPMVVRPIASDPETSPSGILMPIRFDRD